MVETPDLLEHWSWPAPGTKRAIKAEKRKARHDEQGKLNG
jgi:hypothetical protein